MEDFSIKNLISCISDEGQALLKFDHVYKLVKAAIKYKRPGDVVAAIIIGIKGVKQAMGGLQECEAIDTSKFNYDQMMSTYDIISNPDGHFEILEEDILIHGASIKGDLWKA